MAIQYHSGSMAAGPLYRSGTTAACEAIHDVFRAFLCDVGCKTTRAGLFILEFIASVEKLERELNMPHRRRFFARRTGSVVSGRIPGPESGMGDAVGEIDA